MFVWEVGFMVADFFEKVLEIVGDEIHAHEEEENRHGEAGKDFGALEPEGMANRRPFPDFEVGEDIDRDAKESSAGIKEYEV